MRPSAQFARRLPTVPAATSLPARQMDFSRPVSRAGTVGFAFLSLVLATATFVITIWGTALPLELPAMDTIKHEATTVIAREFVPAAEPETVFEPKTMGRLPVFGGMTPIE